MIRGKQQNWHKGPVKVRQEHPGIEEAIAAARDLADDPAEIAALAAGFMGVPVEEVRPLVTRQRPTISIAPRAGQMPVRETVVEYVRRRPVRRV
jgi:hypothetical protein